MQMPPSPPASVDLVRGEDLDTMDDWISEALFQLESAPWIEANERNRQIIHLSRIGWRVARGLIPASPVDGSIVTTVVDEAKQVIHDIFERNPERMERRAARLDEAGKKVEAAKLRAEIAEVRQRIGQREARRGNGSGS